MTDEIREQPKEIRVEMREGCAAPPPDAPTRDAPAGPGAGLPSAGTEPASRAALPTPAPDVRRFTGEELGRLVRAFQILDSWDRSLKKKRREAA